MVSRRKRERRAERIAVRKERERLARVAGVSVGSGAFARRGGAFSKEAARRSLAAEVVTAEVGKPTLAVVAAPKPEEVLKPTMELIRRDITIPRRITAATREEIRVAVPRFQETIVRKDEVVLPSRRGVVGAVEPAPVTDRLARGAEKAFERFRRAEVAQEREPTFFGAVVSGARAAAAVTRGALVGGRGVGRFVRERPVESALIAAALLTPIPEEIPLLGAFGVRAATGLRVARGGVEIGLGTAFGVEAGRRVRESPTPRLTTAEVAGEAATFGVGFKFLRAATAPRVVKAAILGSASILTGTLVGGRSARARAGRVSKAEIRKRGFGAARDPRITDRPDLFILRKGARGKKGRIRFEKTPEGKLILDIGKRTRTKPIPSGGELVLRLPSIKGKGTDVIFRKSVEIKKIPESRSRFVTSQAVERGGARRVEALIRSGKAVIVKSFSKSASVKDRIRLLTGGKSVSGVGDLLLKSRFVGGKVPRVSRPKTKLREPVPERPVFVRTADVVSRDLRPTTLFRELIEPPVLEKPPKGFRSARIRERLFERVEARRGEVLERAVVARAATTRFRRRVGEIGISVGVGVREVLGLVSPLKVLPIVSPVVIERPALISGLDVGTALTPAIDTISDVDTRLITTPITVTEVTPIVDVIPISTTRGGGRGRPTPTPFIPPPDIPPPSPPPRTPPRTPPPFVPPPFVPPPFFIIRRREVERRVPSPRVRALLPAFDVFLRRRGEFKQIGERLSEASAIGLGARRVKLGLGATFKITERPGIPRKTGIGIPKGFAEEFRMFKIKKGKKVPTPREFIQRRGFRLGTRAERREIQKARGVGGFL